jgi:DNA-binding response OmpR family regulator
VGTVAIGGLLMDMESRAVHVDGKPVELTWTEFEMLAALAARPRAALSRRELIEAVRDERWQGDERVIDVHVAHLRHKLCDDVVEHRFVRTVRGVGYGMGLG